jgi:hypothetical protein
MKVRWIASRARHVALFLFAPPLFGSCSDPYARFNTRFASDFAPGAHSVSVFGIFRDGRMSSDTWDEVGPKLSAAFGSGTCDAAYRNDLVTANPPLSSAIDDYVRANGIGDELLDALAPAASGDLVVVFTVAGHVTSAGIDGGAASVLPPTPQASMMRNPRYRGVQPMPGGGGVPRSFGGSAGTLEMSASLFSVTLHRSVALVEMKYYGESLDDALSQLAAKLRSSLPGSTCTPWNWSIKIDDHKVRELIDR